VSGVIPQKVVSMNRLEKYSVLILAVVLVSSGCASTRVNKVSQRDISASAADAVKMSKDVMNTYGFDIEAIEPKNGSTRLEGKHANGQDVKIDIVPVGAKTSNIKVQVTDESPRTSAKKILNDISVRYE
jgi:uncharacterized protein (UPF0333 family)